MDEKCFFINEYKSGIWTMTDLCSEFNISRQTGYKYLLKFEEFGYEGLLECSKAPLESPNKIPQSMIDMLKEVKSLHPRYGAKKILTLLKRQYPKMKLPAKSTINLILKREGLVKKRRIRHRITAVYPVFVSTAPNDTWSADFKGKYRMGNHQYISPLTVMDSFSRFLLAARGLYHTTYEETQSVFEQLFREYGQPRQIHTDNGSPFAGPTSLGRLSRLGVYFLEHNIDPIYSDPGKPQQNGRHERMHEELKAECARPPASNRIWQQRKLNKFVYEYNFIRPHEALANKTPAEVYVKSTTLYHDKITSWDYPKDFKVKRVCQNGAIRWNSYDWVMVTTPLIGKCIGLYELDNGIWRVFFRNKLLGYLDEKTLRIHDYKGRVNRSKKCQRCP